MKKSTRPKTVDDKQLVQLYKSGLSGGQIAKKLNLHRSTVYSALGRHIDLKIARSVLYEEPEPCRVVDDVILPY
jgi:IS30 family transposase